MILNILSKSPGLLKKRRGGSDDTKNLFVCYNYTLFCFDDNIVKADDNSIASLLHRLK